MYHGYHGKSNEHNENVVGNRARTRPDRAIEKPKGGSYSILYFLEIKNQVPNKGTYVQSTKVNTVRIPPLSLKHIVLMLASMVFVNLDIFILSSYKQLCEEYIYIYF